MLTQKQICNLIGVGEWLSVSTVMVLVVNYAMGMNLMEGQQPGDSVIVLANRLLFSVICLTAFTCITGAAAAIVLRSLGVPTFKQCLAYFRREFRRVRKS